MSIFFSVSCTEKFWLEGSDVQEPFLKYYGKKGAKKKEGEEHHFDLFLNPKRL